LHTGPIVTANSDFGSDVSATLTVSGDSLLSAPTVLETITPASIVVGGTAQISITLTNNDPTHEVTGIHLTDVYSPGLENAPSALVDNTCGGVLILHPHDPGLYADDFHLYNGTIPAGGTCRIVLNVVGQIGGGITPTSFLTNDTNANAEAGGYTTASIAVVDGSLLDKAIASKQFAPPSVAVGETSEMTIELTNTNQFLPINGAQFTDNYPPGIANVPSGTVLEGSTNSSVRE